MKNPMKPWILTLFVAVALPVVAQTAGDDALPSAPSATLEEQKPKPTPVPAPTPAPPPPAAAVAPAPAKKPAVPAASPVQAASRANNRPSNEELGIPTIRTNVDEVRVIFTVTDKRGRFVKDLVQKDFTVLDDRRPVDKINNFSHQTNLPLRVGLLVDTSTSIRDRFKFEQESAIEFLNDIIRAKFDKAFVMGFDSTAEVTQDFTDDTDLLNRGVRGLRPAGGTAIYDAVYRACRDKLMKESAGTAVRKAIILLSDGEDNQSVVTREEAVEMAQRSEVIIYAISTNTSGLKLRGDKVLERFADATGGRAFFPFKVSDVANAFQEIQDELRSQYAIAYKPANFQADGRYHAIEIAADNKKYKVRARKGYYAPKP